MTFFNSTNRSKTTMYCSPGQIITINCSYLLPQSVGLRGKVYQLRTDWRVVNWLSTVTVTQFCTSFTNIVLRKLFCSLQSNRIRWIKIRITIGYLLFFEQPLSNLSGLLSDNPDNLLFCSLMSSEKPKRRYSLQLRGAPSVININDRTSANPYVRSLLLLEQSLIKDIRIPMFKEPKEKDLIDFLLDEPATVFYENLQKDEYLLDMQRKNKLLGAESISVITGVSIVGETEAESTADKKTSEGSPESASAPATVVSSAPQPKKAVLKKQDAVLETLDRSSIITLRFVKVVSKTVSRIKKTKNAKGETETQLVKKKVIEVVAMTSASIIETRPF